MPLHTSNIVMQKTDTTPAGANQTEGSLYYDDSESKLKAYDGTAWGAPDRGPNYDRPGDGPYATDSYTKLLIHSDGPNNGTSFVDSSGTPKTVTRNADVIHDTANHIASIGSSALFFDGTPNCYLEIADHADFDAGTLPLTIDCWMKSTSNDNHWKVMIDNRNRTNYAGIGQWGGDPAGQLRHHQQYSVTGGNSNDLIVFDGQWHHVAWQRKGDQTTIHIDGVFMVSATVSSPGASASFTSTCPVRLGVSDLGIGNGGDTEAYTGYIVEPRISIGIARWWRTNFQLWGSVGKYHRAGTH